MTPMSRLILTATICMAAFTPALPARPYDSRQALADPSFRTLQVIKDGNLMAAPIIDLYSDSKIEVSFDEIADDYSRLRYRLVHCNADWQPSRLLESEFLDGFNEAEIDDYAFSRNTYTHYVNYRFEIPSQHMRPTTSGNYVVEIYREDDPDDVIGRARFSVSENVAVITGDASARTDRGVNSDWQQLRLRVSPGVDNINPYADIILSITSNSRPDTERFIHAPSRVEGDLSVYDHMPQLIFPAGNEYRRFETVRADYPGMGVDSISFIDRNYHAWLSTAECRKDRPYSYDSTQRGRFMIDEYNATDPQLGADYIIVHFSLSMPPMHDADIYVEGDLAERRFSERNRMTYDSASGCYTLEMPLKQGSYNYQYVALKNDGNGASDASATEGNKYETVNEYLIKAYLRLPAARADRLIGTANIISNH